MRRFLFTIPAMLLFAPATRADESVRELLPPPREAGFVLPPALPFTGPLPPQAMGPMGPVLPGYFLPDRYAHWQLVAPDRYGFMRPRVIMAPQPYYLYNGEPYRLLPVRPLDMSSFPVQNR
jgi:hypothetical protein